MADMDKAPQGQSDLDDLFAAARGNRPAMPEHLTRAILADAAREQPGYQPVAPAPIGQRRSMLAQLVVAIGGWPALGGLVAASAAGLWVGIAPPDFVPDPGVMAGIDESALTVPYDGYEMAIMLSEDLQ